MGMGSVGLICFTHEVVFCTCMIYLFGTEKDLEHLSDKGCLMPKGVKP